MNMKGQNFICKNMLEYTVLLDGQVNPNNIKMKLDNSSGPLFIQTTDQNITLIDKICEADIADYVVAANIRDTEQAVRLHKISPRDRVTQRLLIESHTTKYGSLDKIPTREFRSLVTRIYFDEIFDYMVPLIREIVSRNYPVSTYSCMLSILAPDIEYNNIDDKSDYTIFSQSLVEKSKKDYLRRLAIIHDGGAMARLYELHITGVITREDIINSGLNNIYAACEWMVNRTFSRVKRAIG